MSDLDFLVNTNEWPFGGVYSYCCLKRYKEKGKMPEVGFLVFVSKVNWNVRTGNIFSGGDGGVIEYDSPEAILADGWVVD